MRRIACWRTATTCMCRVASEVANTIWRKVRLGKVEHGQAGVLITAVSEMPVRWCADETVCADAVRLALALGRPVYDCMYLALAYRLGVRMVTADMRFANALASTEHGSAITTLADHA